MRFNDLAAVSPQLCSILAITLMVFAFWLARELSRVTRQLNIVKIKSGHTGRQTAEDLSRLAHIQQLHLLETTSSFSDYYDSEQKAICLSVETASKSTIAATGIVAHEVGHAIQDREHSWLISAVGNVVLLKIITGNFTLPVFVAGFLLDSVELILAGWIFFSLSTTCNIMIYFVNYDASRRAEGWLRRDPFISVEEERLIERFLRIVGLTYLGGIALSPLEVVFTSGRELKKLIRHKPWR